MNENSEFNLLKKLNKNWAYCFYYGLTYIEKLFSKSIVFFSFCGLLILGMRWIFFRIPKHLSGYGTEYECTTTWNDAHSFYAWFKFEGFINQTIELSSCRVKVKEKTEKDATQKEDIHSFFIRVHIRSSHKLHWSSFDNYVHCFN